MRHYRPGTRPPSQLVAEGGVGGIIWYVMLVITIAFWPSILVHGPEKVGIEWAWYGGVGVLLLIGMVVVSVNAHEKSRPSKPLPPSPIQFPREPFKPPPPPPPHPVRPDLRETPDATRIER